MTSASAAERIHLCRAHDGRAGIELAGARRLPDRLWRSGVAKTDMPGDAWIRDVTPSTGLRKWFDHDPVKWAEFGRRYQAELRDAPLAVETALDWCHKGSVTPIHAAKGTRHTDALVLRDYLEARLPEEAST